MRVRTCPRFKYTLEDLSNLPRVITGIRRVLQFTSLPKRALSTVTVGFSASRCPKLERFCNDTLEKIDNDAFEAITDAVIEAITADKPLRS